MSKPWHPRFGDGGRRPRRSASLGELRLMVLGGVFLGLLYAGRDMPAGWAAGRNGGGTGDPRAVRVIDGDTFDLDGVRIRIADIDTPETRGRCPYETALAGRATARMRALLAAGPFELAPNPDGRDQDPYGRKLRIVARDGRSLGGVLVAEGLARRWTGRREPWC